MTNSVDPDQTAPIGAVCSGSTLLASILNSSVLLGNFLQQTTSADYIFRCIIFLGALRVNTARTRLQGYTLECFVQHWCRQQKGPSNRERSAVIHCFTGCDTNNVPMCLWLRKDVPIKLIENLVAIFSRSPPPRP